MEASIKKIKKGDKINKQKGMKDMVAISLEIEKIINTPTKKPTKKEAEHILRSCGILNNKNQIKSAYKNILIKDVLNEK